MTVDARERTALMEVAVPTGPPPSRTVIEASHGWSSLGFRELWRYRELVYFLSWRDVKVRYKQTVLGVGWAIIQPVLNMIVFTVIFGRVAHLPSDGVPYALFTLTALLPWTYFSYVLTQAGNSLVFNAPMLSKVYFPRLVLPLAAAIAGFVDLFIAFVLLAGMMVYFHVHLHPQVLLMPLFLVLATAVALAVGIWFAALNAKFRDVKYVVPLLTQVWLYASPVAYASTLIPGKWAMIYAVNPMAGVIEGFRWTLLGVGPAPGASLAISVGITAIVLFSGLVYFRTVEQTLADVV